MSRTRRGQAQRTDASTWQLNSYAMDLLMVQPQDLRNPAEALAYALRAYEMSAHSYHYNRYTLALACEANGDLEPAIVMGRLAVAHCPLEDSSERREYEATLVRLLEASGDTAGAEQVYAATLAARRDQFPPGHPDIAQSLEALAEFLRDHNRDAEAEILLRAQQIR